MTIRLTPASDIPAEPTPPHQCPVWDYHNGFAQYAGCLTCDPLIAQQRDTHRKRQPND